MTDEEQLWRHRAESLFTILDDIDTASDIAKGDAALYAKLIQTRLGRVKKVVYVDGSGAVQWTTPTGD